MYKIIILTFTVLLSVPLKAEIEVIPQAQVHNYVLSLFRTELVKNAAITPGNTIYNLVQKLSKRPLFVDHPPEGDTLHRENFTAYWGVSNARRYINPNPIINDLYYIHELSHILEMPYDTTLSFEEWRHKMTYHEKEITFLTEFAIHFEFPEIRKLMNFDSIYADKYLNDPKIQELYKKDPKAVFKIIFDEKERIQEHSSPNNLTADEFRSWFYGRTMEVWAAVYGKVSHNIETHMKAYYEKLKVDPKSAVEFHLKWLKSKTKQGVTFRDLIVEYARTTKSMIPNSVSLGTLQNNFTNEEFCQRCLDFQVKMEDLLKRGALENTPLLPIAKRLLSQGVAATVYSYSFPESEEIFYDVVRSFNYRDTYGEAFVRKQDIAHKEFIEAYKEWASPVVQGLQGYNYAYPSNGSSEALKDTISYLRGKNTDANFHIFHGEYEGAPAYADGVSMKVVRHERTRKAIKDLIQTTKPGDIFYISQPSGIDGNIWKDYSYFIKQAERAGLIILVDLAYVGLIPNPYKIDLRSKNIFGVFFSLSKSFGVYYQRIGGAFFRSQNPLLFGNMWFKNLLSLKVGTRLLKSFGIFDIPRKYLWLQSASIQQWNKTSGLSFKPSDVILLATQSISIEEKERLTSTDHQALYRGDSSQGILRVNLTPSFSAFMDIASNSCKIFFR